MPTPIDPDMPPATAGWRHRVPSDEDLMQLAQAGDTQAFAELYVRLAPRAVRAATHFCADSERAADVVQDAFLSMWRHRAAYRAGRGDVVGWAMGIVRNRAIDNWRRGMRHDHQRDVEEVAHVLRAADDVDAAAIESDDAREVRLAIGALPEPQRVVIALAYFGQLSQDEIAEHLGLPLGTVKSRTRLALIRLRTRLAA